MKKIFTAILFTLLLLGFTITVFAYEPTTISEDMQTITYNGENYIRSDYMMYLVTYRDINEKFSFTPAQEDVLEKIELKLDETKKVLYARIRHKDGTIDAAQFVHEQYKEMHEGIQNESLKTYLVDFRAPKGNVLPVDMVSALGSYITLTGYDIDYCDYFLVYAKSDDGILTAITGAVITLDDTYYYLNFDHMKLDLREDFSPWNHEALTMREITDSEIRSQIRSSYNSFWNVSNVDYETSFNISTIRKSAFSDYTVSDFATKQPTGFVFSLIICIILFGAAPLAALICSIIVIIKSSGIYKTLFKIIGVLSIILLIVFGVLLFVLL